MAERAQYTQEEQSAIRDAVTGGEQPLCPRCEVVMTARPIGADFAIAWPGAEIAVASGSSVRSATEVRSSM